jgi:hypothetical protein
VEGGEDGAEEGEVAADGEGTLQTEGSAEGSADYFDPRARVVISAFYSLNNDGDTFLSLDEYHIAFQDDALFSQLDTTGNGMLSLQELQQGIPQPKNLHNADLDGDFSFGLRELLRVVQLYNARGYDCAGNPDSTDDGFELGSGRGLSEGCIAHAGDYVDADGVISLQELLRLVQLFNLGALLPCGNSSEDGFCGVS